MKYFASVSFGKDSLAMLLLLLKNRDKYQLNGVVFYDTGMEFNSIYKIRDRIMDILDKENIEFYELKPDKSFEYMAFEKPVKYRNKEGFHYGYSWCGGNCRWGTTEKLKTINEFEKSMDEEIMWYVGIAYDEPERYNRLTDNKRSILYELKMTEKDCLKYCHDNGYFWYEENNEDVELYDILDRVSCWCCRNKNKKELYNMYKHLPSYWDKLKWFQSKTNIPMKKYRKHGKEYGNVFELEEKFKMMEKDSK